MNRVFDNYFEIFIPGLKAGERFQYEIKLKGDRIYKKNDPYSELIKDGVSCVNGKNSYEWKDADYLKNRKLPENYRILELSSDHFDNLKAEADEIVHSIVQKAVKCKYTHIELCTSLNEGMLQNGTSYLYGINEKLLKDDLIRKLVDSLHKEKIGVIIKWLPAGFGRKAEGLAEFDGTCLYEHCDPRQGVSGDGKKLLFQYGCPQVKSFLMSDGLKFIRDFHVDGVCIVGAAQMLYLDYGKADGSWIPNYNGGNENLEAIAFIKEFIKAVKSISKSALVIAEDSSTHTGMTVPMANDGMGFDLKWNEGFTGEYFDYISFDPIMRSGLQNQLTDELVYAFAEKFVLPLSEGLMDNNRGLLDLFPGNEEQRKNSLKLSIAYAYMHPGYKLISEAMDSAESALVLKLNQMNDDENSLGSTEDIPESFEWLSNLKKDKCFISFIRKTDDPEDMLIGAFNFAGIEQEITMGVPYEGKYRELLNTDDALFGGTGMINKKVMRATDVQSDGRAQSVTLKLAPLSASILKFEAYTEEELAKVIEERIRRNTPIKKKRK